MSVFLLILVFAVNKGLCVLHREMCLCFFKLEVHQHLFGGRAGGDYSAAQIHSWIKVKDKKGMRQKGWIRLEGMK